MTETFTSDTLHFPSSWSDEELAGKKLAVLTSGGVESAILAGLLPERVRLVQPVYVRFGLLWEEAELYHLRRYLKAIGRDNLLDLKVIDLPVADLYADHWSTTGVGVPDASTDDSAVYLPGRNILLTAKTAVWCALNGISAMALGSLQTNPFPDATAEFFNSLENSYSIGLSHKIEIVRPVVHLHKEQALKLAQHLPLELSFSCIEPKPVYVDISAESEPDAANLETHVQQRQEWIHCGACNKCEERIKAFALVDYEDKTRYATKESAAIEGGRDLCIR